MPAYGAAQAGGVLTALGAGEALKLFDGTETPATGLTSIAFARGQGPGGVNPPTTFSIHWSVAPTDSFVIQGSNVDVDAQYQTLFTSTNKQDDNYTDPVDWAFYRAKIVSYSAGTAVVVIAQR